MPGTYWGWTPWSALISPLEPGVVRVWEAWQYAKDKHNRQKVWSGNKIGNWGQKGLILMEKWLEDIPRPCVLQKHLGIYQRITAIKIGAHSHHKNNTCCIALFLYYSRVNFITTQQSSLTKGTKSALPFFLESFLALVFTATWSSVSVDILLNP